MKFFILVFLVASLAGCATTGANPDDPWESYNRKVFTFNDKLDKAVVKPVTKGYQAVTPDIVEEGVSNFFSNLGDISNSANNLLQGNFLDSGSDLLRIVINTTVGFGGLVDVASRAGLTKHDEDFGQTLAVWEISSGPYVMLPLLGPSTLRDTGALVVDYAFDPLTWVDDARLRNSLFGLSLIDRRSALMKAEDVIGDNFFDRYTMIRNAYLAHREALVRNGEEGSDSFEDDELIRELEGL
ncbi:MAG: MlaA family lipoprotein [bacterium]